MKPPRDFASAAPTRELRAALAEPSGCFGRAGRSSWHYNVQRPLGRKAPFGEVDGWMVGWLDGWMVGWLVGWLDGCLDGG
eukprot:Skav228443  [mRNA]  locus=scaffold3588:234835:235074:- [translate_table: standard]